MKRYHREENGDLYDRKMRRRIHVRNQHRIGEHYWINLNKQRSQAELVLSCEDIEERRQ